MNSRIIPYRISSSSASGRITEGKKQSVGPLLKQGKYGRIDSLHALVDGRLNTSVWNKLYRRAVWNHIRFPEGHNYEDMDTFFRILDICDTVYMTDQHLYYHRSRAGSITQTITKDNILDRNLACAHLDAFVQEHTPGIFTKDQLRRIRQSRINSMMIQYVKIHMDTEFAEELKRQVYTVIKGIGIKNCSFRTKAAYFMFRFCPWLLKVSWSIYHPVKMLMWKVTGK